MIKSLCGKLNSWIRPESLECIEEKKKLLSYDLESFNDSYDMNFALVDHSLATKVDSAIKILENKINAINIDKSANLMKRDANRLIKNTIFWGCFSTGIAMLTISECLAAGHY